MLVYIRIRAGFSLNGALFRINVGPLIRAGVRQVAALADPIAGVLGFVPGKY